MAKRSWCAALMIVAVLSVVSSRAFAQSGVQGASQVTVQAGVSQQRVNLGDTLIYQISVDGVSEADAPAIPASDAYSAEFLGGRDESSHSVYIINGRQTTSSTLRYVMQWRITPTKAGAATVPSFPIEVGGKGGVATLVPKVQFNVVEASSSPQFPLSLESERDGTTAYVGEPIRVRLLWTVGGGVKSASFTGPDGGSVYDVLALDPRPENARQQRSEAYPIVPFLNGQAVVQRTQATLDGQTVPAFAMELVITPRQAGKITIGPYRVVFDEVVGQRQRSFFDAPWDDRSQTRRAVSTSNAITLDVKPLPSEGRPANFNGLIGRYTVEAEAGMSEANVGDPVPLTLTVRGPEPMGSAVTPPPLDEQQGFAEWFKPAPEGWEKPLAGSGAAGGAGGASGGGQLGERVFTTTVRPKSDGVTQIPPIELPYFDTLTGRYAVARSEPIPLKVSAVREVTAADALRGGDGAGLGGLHLPGASRQATLSNTAPGVGANTRTFDALIDQRVSVLAMIASPMGIAVVGLPPIALAAAMVLARVKRSADADRLARRAAVAEGRRLVRGASTANEVWRGVRLAVGPWVGAMAEAVTASDAATAELLSEEEQREAAALLRDLESAAYDGVRVDVGDVKRRAESLLGELAKR